MCELSGISQSILDSLQHHLQSCCRPQFGHRILNMKIHGILRNPENTADRCRGLSAGRPKNAFSFSCGQLGRRTRRRGPYQPQVSQVELRYQQSQLTDITDRQADLTGTGQTCKEQVSAGLVEGDADTVLQTSGPRLRHKSSLRCPQGIHFGPNERNTRSSGKSDDWVQFQVIPLQIYPPPFLWKSHHNIGSRQCCSIYAMVSQSRAQYIFISKTAHGNKEHGNQFLNRPDVGRFFDKVRKPPQPLRPPAPRSLAPSEDSVGL